MLPTELDHRFKKDWRDSIHCAICFEQVQTFYSGVFHKRDCPNYGQSINAATRFLQANEVSGSP